MNIVLIATLFEDFTSKAISYKIKDSMYLSNRTIRYPPDTKNNSLSRENSFIGRDNTFEKLQFDP